MIERLAGGRGGGVVVVGATPWLDFLAVSVSRRAGGVRARREHPVGEVVIVA